MPTASGFVKSVAGGSKFNATFLINDIQYHFTGSFNPAVQEFTSNGATLNYENLNQLTATRDFEGRIGAENISFIVTNGPKLQGPLNMPISQASYVSGRGVWVM
ncbi:hypothetical protein B0I35DRAFT_154979 [Stachybotrys elegans]|uniref:Uncharacterized protein n=1 Tax=Stachybotrys elegans TaxID=80388 RepID=A0A8K0SE07_9HYPO|nr:hypothetical protein B0I35DRAFT_154979 [Stachybotrys elegans]